MKKIRQGFTLLELLVVIGIIAVLLGLLLPAVQKVRATAARLQCLNNLKQIGLAAHQYHDGLSAFPSGTCSSGGKSSTPLAGWLTLLLPYVEQEAVWAATQQAYRTTNNPFQNPPHTGLSTVIRTYGCPADSRISSPQLAVRTGNVIALGSYLGVSGINSLNKDGVLYLDSQTRILDITDGASNTLLAGERPPSPDHQYGWWYAGAGQQFTGSADAVLGVQETNFLPQGIVTCPVGPYTYQVGRLLHQCDMFHFWSLHPGGANFLYADGSARFISYSGASHLPAPATRSGGEIVGASDGIP